MPSSLYIYTAPDPHVNFRPGAGPRVNLANVSRRSRGAPAAAPLEAAAEGQARSGGPSIAVVLGLVLVVGMGLGFAARAVFWAPAEQTPASAAVTALIHEDPQALVLQPSDVGADYTIYEDSGASDPGQTGARARYAVRMTRKGAPKYLTEVGVNLYDGRTQAAAALQKLLGLGKFGTELPMRGSLADEARLFAAKDPGIVIASLLWRDRNAVAFVFVYNPYPETVPQPEVDRLARANAYDDALGLATAVEEHIKRAG